MAARPNDPARGDHPAVLVAQHLALGDAILAAAELGRIIVAVAVEAGQRACRIVAVGGARAIIVEAARVAVEPRRRARGGDAGVGPQAVIVAGGDGAVALAGELGVARQAARLLVARDGLGAFISRRVDG